MAVQWRILPGVRRMRELNSGAPYRFRGVHPQDAAFTPLANGAISLVAVISSWNDADIIGQSVKNCFQQGCEEVYLLDNNSEDDSVAVAEAAGAKIGEIYETELYDDDLRILKQNQIAECVIAEKPLCWMLSLDADEFVHGFGGKTVRETLCEMPSHIRTVGSWCVDLYPMEGAGFVAGAHPGKSMTHGVFRRSNFCSRWHWKHVAIRYNQSVFDIAQTRGNHMPAVARHVRHVAEPAGFNLPILHCPYRSYEKAMWRLEKLCGGGHQRRSRMDDDVTSSGGAIRRLKFIEDVYAGRWDCVELPHCEMMYGRTIRGIVPYPWKNYYPDLNL